MEAAGLAVGVVSLGLDLATRLQAYIEGVQGAGDRLMDVAGDVSATASIVRQLADLLEADKATSALPLPKQHQSDTRSVQSSQESDATVFGASSPLPAPKQQPVFSEKGLVEIEAALRRCDQAYGVLVRVLVSATSESFTRTQKVFANAGLSDLTASRLARLTSRAKWPWLEPRIKACQKQLKSIKVDLLLSLHIASLAKTKSSSINSVTGRAEDVREEEMALRSYAEALLMQQASSPEMKESSVAVDYHENTRDASAEIAISTLVHTHQEPAFTSGPRMQATEELSKHLPGLHKQQVMTASFTTTGLGAAPGLGALPDRPGLSSFSMQTSPGQMGQLGFRAQISPLHAMETMNSNKTPVESSTMSPKGIQNSSDEASAVEGAPNINDDLPPHPFADKPLYGDSFPMGTFEYKYNQDVSDVEAWLLTRSGADPGFLNFPLRGPALVDILHSCSKVPTVPALHQFMALSPEQKDAVIGALHDARHRDDRGRTLAAVYMCSALAGLPESAEMLVLVSADRSKHEIVDLEDTDGCHWPVPFYLLKSALVHAKKESDLEAEILRRCNGTAHRGSVRLFTDPVHYPSLKSEFPSFLKDDLFYLDDDPFFGTGSSMGAPISFATLREALRPNMRIRLARTKQMPRAVAAPPTAQNLPQDDGFNSSLAPSPFIPRPNLCNSVHADLSQPAPYRSPEEMAKGATEPMFSGYERFHACTLPASGDRVNQSDTSEAEFSVTKLGIRKQEMLHSVTVGEASESANREFGNQGSMRQVIDAPASHEVTERGSESDMLEELFGVEAVDMKKARQTLGVDALLHQWTNM